jgi:hypothetical protein
MNNGFSNGKRMKKVCAYVLLPIAFMTGAMLSQQQAVVQGQGLPPGDNVIGKVTAATKDTVTVTPILGGDPVTVKVGGDTRVIKDRQPASLSDIKTGDTVVARGPLKGQTMEASFLLVVDPSMIQRMQNGGFGGGGGAGPMSQFKPEDMGKKYIAGEVKAINETKLTIARPDNQTQDIEVDENTSFKKGKESVTLADITVGDFVRGTGEIKNGIFVPKELNVGRPMRQIRMVGPGGNPQDQKKPDDQKAPDAPKPPPDPPKN